MLRRLSFFSITCGLLAVLTASFAQADKGNRSISSLNSAQRLLERVHKNHPQTFLCGCAYKGGFPNHASCGYLPKKQDTAAYMVVWAPVVPFRVFGAQLSAWQKGHPKCKNSRGQPFRGRRCAEKMSKRYRLLQADLYNLQPMIAELVGLRTTTGPLPFEKRDFGSCDVEVQNGVLEPGADVRGDVARTFFYMDRVYPDFVFISAELRRSLDSWHLEDPVDVWECQRSRRIQEIQGNLNPVLDEACHFAITHGVLTLR